MKWFEHHTDSHNNVKFLPVLEKYGTEGYGLYWLCLELVGREGHDFCIKKDKSWLLYLKKVSGLEENKIKEILECLTENNLIDKKALNRGELYTPKLQERLDQYTKRVRSRYGQSTDNVPLQDKTIHNKTEQSSSLKKKPYFQGKEMRKSKGKWWVLPEDGGQWLEFAGKEDEIKWI